MYKNFKVTVKLADFISHNGQTADPMNPFAKAMKEISAKRKKVEADFKQLSDIEYRAGLYVDPQGRPMVDRRVLESAIVEGAKKSKEGKLALSGLFVDSDMLLDKYDGGPLTVDELVASPAHRLTVAVRVGQSKVMRTRPIFHNVEGSFLLSLDTDTANPSQLKQWLEAMVRGVGIGDWRPRHGRGEILSVEEMREPLRTAA